MKEKMKVLHNTYGNEVLVPLRVVDEWDKMMIAAELLRNGGKTVNKNGKKCVVLI